MGAGLTTLQKNSLLQNKFLWAALASLILLKITHKKSIATPKRKLLANYDYIVVGTGSSGSVVAARLSELPDVRVLVLEAGEDTDREFVARLPSASPMMQGTAKDWAFKTEKQDYSHFHTVDGKSKWPRGKVCGGSSILNYMAYVRGVKSDYDLWEELGCAGWSWDDVLPYFKKSEDCRVEELKGKSTHGTGGPLSVSPQVTPTESSDWFIKACDEAGIRKNPDYNGGDNVGSTRNTSSTRDGERCSTATAFLRPALKKRPQKLHLVTRALVTRVLFNEKKEAIGVAYRVDGKGEEKVVHADKEVIICAGAVQSPQLLSLSGIGPREELERFGIRVIFENPNVGAHLIDHLVIPIAFESKVATLKPEIAKSLMSLLRYIFFKTGPLASTLIEAHAFFHTGVRTDIKSPDMQFHFLPAQLGPDDMKNTGIKPEFFPPETKGFSFTIVPTLLHPKSEGSIRLQSSNPADPPLIQPNYLQHRQDVQSLVEGCKTALKLMETKTWPLFAGKVLEPEYPDAPGPKYSDEYWEYVVRHGAVTVYHPAGTCAMGSSESKTAVVDNRLKVLGVSRLRVCDASIMPALVSGNTNAPCIMIGEKGADLIKEDYRK